MIPPQPGAESEELGRTIGDATTLPPRWRDQNGSPVIALNAWIVPSVEPTATNDSWAGPPAVAPPVGHTA